MRRRAMRDCSQFRRSELAGRVARDAFNSFTDTLFGLLYQKSGGRGRNAPTRGVCRALRVITRSRKFWIHDSHGRAGKVLARSLGGVWGIFAKIRGRVVRVRDLATLGLWPVHVVRVRVAFIHSRSCWRGWDILHVQVRATLGPWPGHVVRVGVLATLGLWPVHVVRVRVQATLGPRPIHVMRVRVHVMRDDRVWLTLVRRWRDHVMRVSHARRG